jgi:frizzled protein 1/7
VFIHQYVHHYPHVRSLSPKRIFRKSWSFIIKFISRSDVLSSDPMGCTLFNRRIFVSFLNISIEINFLVSAVKPCRSLCEEARRGCESIMKQFGYSWSTQLHCSQYPIDQPCFEAPKDNNQQIISSKYSYDSESTCSYQFRTNQPELKYKIDHDYNCAMPCNRSLFTNEHVYFVRHYVGILSILCLLSTLFTIITYSIDLSRFRYPERPILYLSICYFILACAYVGGFVDYFYGSNIVCNTEDFSQTGQTRFIVQGTHNKLCVLTFLLIYYFGMASMIWWVILTLTWFLAAGLKWGHEAIDSQAVYFHLASWGIPACLSVALISKRSIDGDYLTGVCYTGLTEPNVQRGFIIVPICIFLSVGLCFLLSGFISVFKIRTVMKHEGTKTDKLERFMVRIGTFSVVYIIPQLILIICLFYEQNNYSSWLQTWKSEQKFCLNSSNCQINDNEKVRPRYELFMIKYTCMLAIGIISAGWVLNGKTIASWRKFFSRQRRSSGSELL